MIRSLLTLGFSLILLANLGIAKEPEKTAAAAARVQQADASAGINIKGGVVEVGFPTKAEKPETAWKITWRVDKKYGLIVKGAWFFREDKWIKVLHDARVAEIHVPYYNSDTRYFDIGDDSTKSLRVTDDMAKPGRNLDNKAVFELRDTGVQWMKVDGKGPTRMRRGEELVLWAPLEAAWYLYLIEYRFRDDGSISLKAGSTGFNSRKEPHVTHMHNALWRLDVDLGVPDGMGNVKNSVRWVTHKEPAAGKRATQESLIERPFLEGVEGGEVWKAESFSRLRILNEAEKNDQGHPISYELVPIRTGSARHFQDQEAFTAKDIWVTPFAGDNGKKNREPNELDCRKLPQYVKQGRSIDNEDIVVWYLSSALHVPRDEDMLNRNAPGVTTTVWSGFELRPRDLFSSSPFYTRRAN